MTAFVKATLPDNIRDNDALHELMWNISFGVNTVVSGENLPTNLDLKPKCSYRSDSTKSLYLMYYVVDRMFMVIVNEPRINYDGPHPIYDGPWVDQAWAFAPNRIHSTNIENFFSAVSDHINTGDVEDVAYRVDL